jgi:sporulation protein YlmC with PRC-barrel domain
MTPGQGPGTGVWQAGGAMAQTAEFVIGAEAGCTDGPCGQVTRVVIDPIARAVTHLVVEPKHRQGLGRLVPLSLVSGGATQVRLACTLAEFQRLDSAEETQFVPGSEGYADYGPSQVLAWPYYGLRGEGTVPGIAEAGPSVTVTRDALPPGQVAVRRGEPVHATDGPIGHVQGLVVDPRGHHVTHVLLQEGHLWGRKQVAIPVAEVSGTEDGIRLRISRDQVKDLPPVDIEHPAG